MKQIFLFRITAILLLSVCSLCLRSEQMACKISTFSTIKPAPVSDAKKTAEPKNNADGILPYYPLIIKI